MKVTQWTAKSAMVVSLLDKFRNEEVRKRTKVNILVAQVEVAADSINSSQNWQLEKVLEKWP